LRDRPPFAKSGRKGGATRSKIQCRKHRPAPTTDRDAVEERRFSAAIPVTLFNFLSFRAARSREAARRARNLQVAPPLSRFLRQGGNGVRRFTCLVILSEREPKNPYSPSASGRGAEPSPVLPTPHDLGCPSFRGFRKLGIPPAGIGTFSLGEARAFRATKSPRCTHS
jgi:hypothetical protein